jgi:DNA modification methylase
MQRPIENNSRPGDGVYDPFLGSGTTVMAATLAGRQAFGMEVDPRYVDVAVKRWALYTKQQPRLQGSGQTFDEIAAERMPIAAE